MQGNRKRTPIWMYLLGGIAAGYAGYLFHACYQPGVDINSFMEKMNVVTENPFGNYWNAGSPKAVITGIFVYSIGILMYVTSKRNYMPGKEYGSAVLANSKVVSKRFQDKNDSLNRVFSENVKISINTRKTRINNNVLVIGGAGSGKTLFLVKPNLMQMNTSFIVTDPKGEILRNCGGFLKAHGYRVITFNMIEMDKSNGYNPFDYIRSETDIIKLITNLIANTTPKNAQQNDPFWEKAETLYLQALFYYVWLECPPEERNFRTVLKLLNEAEVKQDGSPSDLDRRFRRLERKKGSDHPALIQYNKVIRGAGDTVRSIIISANARLALLENPSILRILDKDEMRIAEIGAGIDGDGQTKTALFCVIPDSDKSYNFLIGMLYSQIFQELYYQADFNFGGRLPVHVTFMLDEFSNVALPDDYCSLLSTMRSREISSVIIIQNLAQIKALFKDTWETIPGNCDVLLYLGGNEQGTHKFVSESLGKGTIDKRSSGETRGRNGSSSRNYDVLGRELLTPDETRKLDNKKCILFVRGCDPIIDNKFNTFAHPLFKESEDGGALPYIHDNAEGKKENKIKPVGKKSWDYYKKCKKNGEAVFTAEIQLEELLALEEGIPEKLFTDEELEENRLQLKSPETVPEAMKKSKEDLGKRNEELLWEKLQKEEFTADQLEQVRLGLHDGLSIGQVLTYLHPEWSIDKMAEKRKEWNTA